MTVGPTDRRSRRWLLGIAGCLALLAGGIAPAAAEPWQRPFGPDAPWNVPVEALPRHPQSDHYADLLWDNSTAARPGNFNLGFEDYTYPVYYAAEATGLYPVDTVWDTDLDGSLIPWNPAWAPAPGTDAQVIVLDRESGREWDLWQVRFDGSTVHATNGSLVPGDYRTYEGANRPSRGVGIQYLAMLVRPEAVAAGVIDHALSMPIINTDGDTFVAPATKLEHPGNPPGIPEGMRFALDVTDAEIDAWVQSLPRGLPTATRRAARTIGVALRDYGWFITDTSGGAFLQFEANVSAGEEWAALGLADREIGSRRYPRDLLDGLMRRDRIYAIVPSDQYP
jgi:hypothetical protein